MSTRTVTNKTTHLGRAGEFAAMSEILARGWNVAIPEVDMGNDVFVAQDDGTRLTRVQVKTSQASVVEDAWLTETIKVPYRQLMREGDEVLGPGGLDLQSWRNAWGRFELLMVSLPATASATEADRTSHPGPPRRRGGGGRRGSGSSAGG